MTNTHEKYFYTFRIYQIIFTYSERKKKRPNYYGIFSQTLPISTAFTAILKITLPQCNAIGVRTLHDYFLCVGFEVNFQAYKPKLYM